MMWFVIIIFLVLLLVTMWGEEKMEEKKDTVITSEKKYNVYWESGFDAQRVKTYIEAIRGVQEYHGVKYSAEDIIKFVEKHNFNMNQGLILAIMKVESEYKIDAENTNTNGTIDYGLMQLNYTHIPVIINKARNRGDLDRLPHVDGSVDYPPPDYEMKIRFIDTDWLKEPEVNIAYGAYNIYLCLEDTLNDDPSLRGNDYELIKGVAYRYNQGTGKDKTEEILYVRKVLEAYKWIKWGS